MSAESGQPADVPAPRYRLSDQERDEAIQALSGAYAEGRLDVSEFEERMGQAGQARFADELDVLFVDLPPRPRTRPPLAVTPSGRRSQAGTPGLRQGQQVGRTRPATSHPGVALLIAVLAVIALVATGHFWVLFPAWFLIGGLMHGPARGRSRCGGRSRTW